MSYSFESRTERIDIFISYSDKKLLQQAAVESNKNVSEFLLEHGLIAAQDTLINRKVFALDDEQWQSFQNVLDSPTTDKPALRRLLTEPSVFE
jgi:uncharacterized protein (DUF1778 family)